MSMSAPDRCCRRIQASRPWSPPVCGALAAVFGIAALFGKATLVLAPVAIVLSLIALCLKQFSWAMIGASTAIAALVTSIWFWTLLGLGWMAAWLVSYLI